MPRMSKQGPEIMVSVRIPTDIKDKLADIAMEQGCTTVGSLVRQIVVQYARNYNKDE